MKILKNKRGIAIENAIIFMIVIFSLCFLITSIAMIGRYQVKIENNILLNEVEIDQIGEDFLESVKTGQNFEKVYEDYSYEVEGNALSVWSKTDESREIMLYVKAELTDGKANVMCWRYSLPETTP